MKKIEFGLEKSKFLREKNRILTSKIEIFEKNRILAWKIEIFEKSRILAWKIEGWANFGANLSITLRIAPKIAQHWKF